MKTIKYLNGRKFNRKPEHGNHPTGNSTANREDFEDYDRDDSITVLGDNGNEREVKIGKNAPEPFQYGVEKILMATVTHEGDPNIKYRYYDVEKDEIIEANNFIKDDWIKPNEKPKVIKKKPHKLMSIE